MISKWPHFSDEQIKSVVNVLSSGKVNAWQGEECKLFESEFSKFCGCKYSIAVSNGSLALSLCYLAIGIKPGDEIITTPRSFIATSSSIALLKAIPIFADVDINSGCITEKTIRPLITKKTKAISIVHFAGWPAEMDKVVRLAKEFNLFVIEDCAQAHGGGIKINQKFNSVGSFGDVAAWSFCTDKIISTGGEGGMVTTNNKKLWELMWSFKDHGKDYKKVLNKGNQIGFKWLHDKFGSNFRMTEMQAAIGRKQLRCLTEWSKRRKENADIIVSAISKIPLIRIPINKENEIHAWYKFYCYLELEYLEKGWDQNKIVQEINSLNYPAYHGGCSEVYLEKCFENSKSKPEKRLTNAKKLGETSLMFLVDPTIQRNEMINYAKVISRVLKNACKNY